LKYQELAFAVIKPGLIYRQQPRRIEPSHHDLWCENGNRPREGSMIDNALDRGPVTIHHAYDFGTLWGISFRPPGADPY
jgi:hypothetical protein